MLILAVNTATPSISAALWQDRRLLAEMTLQASQPHAVTLLPVIQDLLERTSHPATAIDAYACAVGPGSYTGIRIGVSAVKAMAYATGKPAVGISTLQALAWPYAGSGEIIACPVLDARNSRIYAAAWQGGRCLIPEANWLAGDFLDQLRQIPAVAGQPDFSNILLVGSLPREIWSGGRNFSSARAAGRTGRPCPCRAPPISLKLPSSWSKLAYPAQPSN